MARVTIEDCLKHVDNRFGLVVLATRRSRQLMQGADPTVKTKNKALVTALREIAVGNVVFELDKKRVKEVKKV